MTQTGTDDSGTSGDDAVDDPIMSTGIVLVKSLWIPALEDTE